MGMYCGEAANARVMTTDAWLMVSFDRGATLNRLQGSLSTRKEADVALDADEISPEVADVVLDADVLGTEDEAGVEDGNGASATRGGR